MKIEHQSLKRMSAHRHSLNVVYSPAILDSDKPKTMIMHDQR